ncbi:MAG: hypothetical protein ACFFCX_11710 [Candidatus Sifarchaeia archaeon]
MKLRSINLLMKTLVVWIMIFSMLQSNHMINESISKVPEQIGIQLYRENSFLSDTSDPIFFDYFNASLGYNDSLWNLESFGNGSVSWVNGEFFNMSAQTHAFRTLSSKQTFAVGHEVNIRMRMQEAETVVCVGWTNQTPETGWNYLFWDDSVYIETAQSTQLLTHKSDEEPYRTFKLIPQIDASEFHDYRIVWNSSVIIAYIDGNRVAALGGDMPEGPLHFKVAITEFRNMDTEGWICVDSIEIREHNSMITENPPFITLDSPGNTTLNLGHDPIEVVLIGSNGTLYWTWDGAQNSSSTKPFDIRLPYEEGLHTLDVYCKDGYGYNNWAHERYEFETMVTPPMIDAKWFGITPAIDGVIQTREWPQDSFQEYKLARGDGTTVLVNISLGCDGRFFFVGIDSPVPSGHDSRAAVIVTGQLDGHYHGLNETPVTTAYYTKGSPDAWSGYTELKYLNEKEDNIVDQPRIEPIPAGFLAESTVQGSHVHYEFRFPLTELATSHGEIIGISFMIFPTGMGVHSLYYPIADPWENASRLALVRLPPLQNTLLLQIGVVSVIGFVALATYFTFHKNIKSPDIGMQDTVVETLERSPEVTQRIIGIIESYDKIGLDRLSRMTNLEEPTVREIVFDLISKKSIYAKIVDNDVIRGD